VGAVRAGLRSLPLRTRVSLLAALGVGLAVALTSVAAYVTVRAQLRHQLDSNLVERAEAAVSTPLADPARLVQVPAAALGAADVRIALARADRVGFISPEDESSAPPIGQPELDVARGLAERSLRTAAVGGETFRVVAVPAAPGFALVLAQSTEQTERTLTRLGVVLLLVGVVGMAAAATAGLGIARAGLRPVERLTRAAEHVAATERLDPIEVRGDDEIARLTAAFNAMLAALAASRQRQRQLVGDAGHELRTPLTSLRTNLDLLAQSERRPGLSEQDRTELLADVRAQLEELSELVGDLVELAREEPLESAPEPVELADVVARAVDRVRRRAPHVRFAVSARPWRLCGDPAALERAVTNLLDNAAKWSPPEGTVTVSLRDGVLEVADEGPGIADVDLPHVFDRFYRAPEARALPGSGLGLAIVKHAVERHGGTAAAGRSPSGGALISVRLPADSGAALC